MAEIPGHIHIGGRLSRSLVNTVTGGKFGEPGTYEAGVWCIEEIEGRPLLVCNDNTGLKLDDCEEAWPEANLAFDWYSEGRPLYGIENELIASRPGVGEKRVICDFDWGLPLSVSVEEIEAIIDDPKLDRAGVIDQLRNTWGMQLALFLRDHPLPALEIVEDEVPVPVAP